MGDGDFRCSPNDQQRSGAGDGAKAIRSIVITGRHRRLADTELANGFDTVEVEIQRCAVVDENKGRIVVWIG